MSVPTRFQAVKNYSNALGKCAAGVKTMQVKAIEDRCSLCKLVPQLHAAQSRREQLRQPT